MSNKETITVQYVNPPKEGKKQGSVKTSDGRFFGVYPELLSAFPSAGTYEIEFKSRDFNGKQYHTVTSAKPVSGQGGGINGGNGNGQKSGQNDRSTSDQIRWQTCLKVAGDVHSGNAVPASVIVAYARELFAADPIIEAAKEIFNATPQNAGEAPEPNW